MAEEEVDYDERKTGPDAGNCLTWKELDKLVLVPDRPIKLTWDLLANTIYLVNIFVSSTLLAFNLLTYQHFWHIEFAIDIVVFVDMMLYFFTAFEGESEGD